MITVFLFKKTKIVFTLYKIINCLILCSHNLEHSLKNVKENLNGI